MSNKKTINAGKHCKYGACQKPAFSRGFCRYHYRIEHDEGGLSEERKLKKELYKKEEKEKKRLQVLSSLSDEELKKLFLTPCKTRQELMNFVKFFFGLHLPDQNVSRYTDTNPFDALWEMYQITVLNKNPDNIKEFVYCASRGSGKTISVAIAQLLAVVHGRRDVVHVGAILNQAERCYAYVKGFMLGSNVKNILSPSGYSEDQRILRKDTMSKSVLNFGARDHTIEIVPCTLKSVNGPHVSFVTVDEVDTLATGEQMKAYKDISGMLDSRDGKKPLRVNISTRKSRYGLMNQLMENAEKQGRTVRRWTVFEFMERCADNRSGVMKQTYYIDQMKFDIKTEAEFASVPEQSKKEYSQHDMYVGCYKCPIAPICLGDAKKQTSKSPMLKTIDEVGQKVLSEGPDWALSQLMNLKPSVEGIVYKEFDERQHVLSWNKMWEKLTSTTFPGTCDHDTFIKKCHAMGLQAYSGIDWGWSNPSTLVVFFVDKRENIYVVRCDGQTYVSNPTWINHIKTKWHNKYKVSLYFPDSADPGNIQEMQKSGLPTSDKAGKSKVTTGVQVIKKWLRAPGSADAKIFLAEETCKPIIKEFLTYHYKTSPDGLVSDDIDTEDDHWLDALRYAMEGVFGKASVLLSSESMEAFDTSAVMNASGQYLKAPTPAEWALVNNVTINSPDDTKIGKVGRWAELEGGEDDSGVEGEGGMMWSF